MTDSLTLAYKAEVAACYDVATNHAHEALAQARREQDKSKVAQAHKLLGDIAARQGQPRVARKQYAAVLDTADGATPPPADPAHLLPILVYTYVAQADLASRFGETAHASACIERARQLAVEAGDEGLRAWVEAGLAGMIAQRGEPTRACAFCPEAYQPLRELGYAQDAKQAQALMIDVQGNTEEPAFQQAWQEITDEAMPAWLVHG